jgi:hypothetical protein
MLKEPAEDDCVGNLVVRIVSIEFFLSRESLTASQKDKKLDPDPH